MFPHADTIFVVLDMRRQEELQHAARQRLAATAVVATETRLPLLAPSHHLQRALNNVSAFLRIGKRLPHLHIAAGRSGQVNVAFGPHRRRRGRAGPSQPTPSGPKHSTSW